MVSLLLIFGAIDVQFIHRYLLSYNEQVSIFNHFDITSDSLSQI